MSAVLKPAASTAADPAMKYRVLFVIRVILW
jgi:hypothetical protein